jgi:ubiquinone/menaquinone biosynthesis C-methylase UbiE
MNFGHAPLEAVAQPLQPDADDEPNRYCIQLYRHVTSPVGIEGLKVLEVGCGRGGVAAALTF